MTKRSYVEAVLAGLADYEAGKSGAGAPAPRRCCREPARDSCAGRARVRPDDVDLV